MAKYIYTQCNWSLCINFSCPAIVSQYKWYLHWDRKVPSGTQSCRGQVSPQHIMLSEAGRGSDTAWYSSWRRPSLPYSPAAPPTPFLRKWTRSRLSDEGYNYDYLCLHATCHAAHFLVCEEPSNIPRPQRSLLPRWWPSGGEWLLTRSPGCCHGHQRLQFCF